MQSKESLTTQLDWITDKISSRVWTLNVGTLGTTWSLLIAAMNIPESLRFTTTNSLPMFVLCGLAMMCDLVQYLAGFAYNRWILHTLKRSGATEFEYDSSAFLYRLREGCFYAKIALSLIAAIWLLVTLVLKLA